MDGKPASEDSSILEVSDLVLRYGARTAVDGVSLRINRREIFGLLGPNGAGKTSTLSVIEGVWTRSRGVSCGIASRAFAKSVGASC